MQHVVYVVAGQSAAEGWSSPKEKRWNGSEMPVRLAVSMSWMIPPRTWDRYHSRYRPSCRPHLYSSPFLVHHHSYRLMHLSWSWKDPGRHRHRDWSLQIFLDVPPATRWDACFSGVSSGYPSDWTDTGILYIRLYVCMYVCMYGYMDGWMDRWAGM